SRSLPKNLIRSPELTILTLEPLDPLKLRRPRARPLALIPLRLPHPAPQRVTRATDLLRNRLDRRPLRRVFPLGVQHQPNRPLPDLSGVPLCLVHDPNPSKIAASGKPRAVHVHVLDPDRWSRREGCAVLVLDLVTQPYREGCPPCSTR